MWKRKLSTIFLIAEMASLVTYYITRSDTFFYGVFIFLLAFLLMNRLSRNKTKQENKNEM